MTKKTIQKKFKSKSNTEPELLAKDSIAALKQRESAKKKRETRIIRRLKKIPVHKTFKYQIKGGNSLTIKRLTKTRYQVDLTNPIQANIGPVLICKIKDESNYLTYPSLNFKRVLLFGGIGMIIMALLALFENAKLETLSLLTPAIIIAGLQLLLMPFHYFIARHVLRVQLSKI